VKEKIKVAHLITLQKIYLLFCTFLLYLAAMLNLHEKHAAIEKKTSIFQEIKLTKTWRRVSDKVAEETHY